MYFTTWRPTSKHQVVSRFNHYYLDEDLCLSGSINLRPIRSSYYSNQETRVLGSKPYNSDLRIYYPDRLKGSLGSNDSGSISIRQLTSSIYYSLNRTSSSEGSESLILIYYLLTTISMKKYKLGSKAPG